MDAADDIPMTVDHIPTKIVARTADNTLRLKEDNIGLWAEATVTEERVVRAAKEGKLKGWSFGMTNVLDAVERTSFAATAHQDGSRPCDTGRTVKFLHVVQHQIELRAGQRGIPQNKNI